MDIANMLFQQLQADSALYTEVMKQGMRFEGKASDFRKKLIPEDKVEKLWEKRGTNPIEANPALAD